MIERYLWIGCNYDCVRRKMNETLVKMDKGKLTYNVNLTELRIVVYNNPWPPWRVYTPPREDLEIRFFPLTSDKYQLFGLEIDDFASCEKARIPEDLHSHLLAHKARVQTRRDNSTINELNAAIRGASIGGAMNATDLFKILEGIYGREKVV